MSENRNSKLYNPHFWEHHVIGPISTNCYVFGSHDNAIMIDPGGPEAKAIAQNLLDKEVEIRHILVSHGHFDHLGWAPEVLKVSEGAKVYLHQDEKPVYENFLDSMQQHFGLPKIDLREPDIWIKDNQILNLSSSYEFKVIHTPGHSPGSVTFLLDFENFENSPHNTNSIFTQETAFVGDCLFRGSIGRVDLLHSNPDAMLQSLKRLMKELANTHLHPGHGPDTNMGQELLSNKFLLAIQANKPIF